jgi:hypothetical protein
MEIDREALIKALRPEDGERSKSFDASMNAMLDIIETGGMEKLHPALKPWVMDSALGPMVKHPFLYFNLAGGMMAGQANKAYVWKIKVRREYLDERNWWGYLMAHERPYRMLVLERLWQRKRITKQELREILLDIWTDTEMPQNNQDVPVMLFHAAGFISDKPKHWVQLPEEITLYRGVDGELELTADGPSWTLDLKIARFFAFRFGAHGTVYRYVANKSEALAHITDREEAEIILDFDGASDRDRIEVEEEWHE